MYDKLELIGKSLVQHGKYNDRIYLLDLNPKDLPNLFTNFKKLVSINKYSKIIAKVPKKYKAQFIGEGYIEEAFVPNFYNGKEDMSFLVIYPKKERQIDKQKLKIQKILNIALSKMNIKDIKLNKLFTCRKLDEKDILQMISVYKKVFTSYPFPIFEEDYLKQTMCDNVIYFGVFLDNHLIGISSCEIKNEKSYVEMTDFATLEKYRGKQISLYLLSIMEKEMKKIGIKKAYTMARSLSYGMNIAFSKLGYAYSGTVTNNANISGDIESLNIWHKDL